MFQVPDSLSPPSTPDTNPRRAPNLNGFSFSNPSTTPAALPPTSVAAASTTPAGPPPSSLFSSSQKASIPIPYPGTKGLNKKNVGKSPFQRFQSLIQNEPLNDDELMHCEDVDESLDLRTDGVFKSEERFNLHEIATGLAQSPTSLHENDTVILRTEQIIENVSYPDPARSLPLLPNAVQELILVWLADQDRRVFGEYGIGPGESASALSKAAYVSSLLFTIHHPPRRNQSRLRIGQGDLDRDSKPLTEALLDWLREYHFPSLQDYEDILTHHPNCAAHDRFWDVVFTAIVRGELGMAVQLLEDADFAQAVTASHDGALNSGLHGRQLGNVQKIIRRAVQVLQSCPGFVSGDWSIHNSDWTIFRKRVNQALADLDTYTEGVDKVLISSQSQFSKLSSIANEDNLSMTRSPQVESKVPWTIYQNIGCLYRQLLGAKSEILAASGDWLEALIGMTVWCQYHEKDGGKTEFLSSRRTNRSFRNEHSIDGPSQTGYRQSLRRSICELLDENRDATEDPEMQINPADPVEIGLACACAGDQEGLLALLRGWSATISTAVVEVADAGRWLSAYVSASDGLFDGFSDDDLLVLSYAKEQSSAVKKDEILLEYSRLVQLRNRYFDDANKRDLGAWQLAIRVTARMDNRGAAAARIEEILDQERCTSSSQVNEAVSLLDRIGFSDLSQGISLRYADHLMQSTCCYGEAIIHYVQANDLSKMRNIVDVLTSMSLVQSIAYPPASELDDYSLSLFSAPKKLISRMDELDADAGQTLLRCISGYATIRSFYELRDHEILARERYEQPTLRPLASKREAAGALVAAIMSAADGIHGGLYDDSIQSAIQVDGLLVLLGEALVFINQPQPILTPGQTFAILKAVEDLSTVSNRIRAQCEESFKSALASYHGSEPPSPRSMMKKSMSGSLLASSIFSMIGSEMLQPQHRSKQSSEESSGVLVNENGNGNERRGWDWRRGLDKDSQGEDVLRILRLGLAKEVSRLWLESRG